MRTLALSAPLVPSAFFLVWVKLNHEVKDGRILDRGKLDVLIPPEVLYQDCRFPFATALSSAMPLSIRQSNFARRQLRQAQIGKLQIHISSLAQNRLVVSRCAPGRQVSRTSPTQITPVFQLLTESGVEIRLAWMAPLKNLISCFLTP